MTDSKEVSTQQPDQTRQSDIKNFLRIPVDIFEDAEGITLLADMPGVSKDRLNLQIENDSLIVEGDASIDMPEDMNAMYADIQSTRYQRSFSLSSELDTDGIDANLKDGVLRVRIPKRAEVRPRKIDVQVG